MRSYDINYINQFIGGASVNTILTKEKEDIFQICFNIMQELLKEINELTKK